MKKFLLVVLSLMLCATASASVIKIDMEAIKKIESGGDPHAWNTKSGARGLYQITAICLADYNMFHRNDYTLDDLFDPEINFEIADWYINDRIPSMLDYYCKPITTRNIIYAYNYGIGHLIQGDPMPIETKSYIRKYKRLTK